MVMFDIKALQEVSDKPYLEFLKVSTMSMGLYQIQVGDLDRQPPHSEDEVYYVVSGKSMFTLECEESQVGAGTIIYVPSHTEHRFHSVTEDLSILVFFAPPEHSRDEG